MKNNELFTIKPSLRQYYGRTVTKDMKFKEKTDNGEIEQKLENLVLTTTIHRKSEFEGIKSKEYSKLTQEIPEGTILIWSDLEGYIIPNTKMYKLKDLENEIKEIKDIYKDNTDINPVKEWFYDFRRDETKSIFFNRRI